MDQNLFIVAILIAVAIFVFLSLRSPNRRGVKGEGGPILGTSMEVKTTNLRELKKEALEEAMQSLGYLKLDAFTPMLKLLMSDKGAPSKQLATKHRKQGEQLTAEEKKSLGIRKNSFFSNRAFAELTEKGIKNPLQAHEITLLRATLYSFRARSVRRGVEAEFYEFIIHGAFREECPTCARLDGKKVSASEARPQGAEDCPRDACGIGYSPSA